MFRIAIMAGLVSLATACSGGDKDPPGPLVSEDLAGGSTMNDSRWSLSERDFGPITIGMDVAQTAVALGGDFSMPTSDESCTYGTSKQLPPGTDVMVVDGRVARIDVSEGDVTTVAGVRIGQTDAQVRAAYPNQVKERPHKYTDGKYLIVTPGAPADTMYRYVFETEGDTVTRFRAGMMPMVEWIEGCS